MNVLVLHVDGKIVNFAAAKLVGFHRANGDHVELRNLEQHPEDMHPRLGDPKWDIVYASLIFEWSRPIAHELQRLYPGIVLGGTGWDFEDGVQVRRTDLPPEIESATPDYGGYPGITYSLGFAQRGCRRACGFCVVPRKEGLPRPVATLRELWRGEPWPKHIMLLDNDFFGNPRWREIIAEAIEHGFTLSVIQGINARNLTNEQADAIASVRWFDDNFERTRVYTAWDDEGDERELFRGLGKLKARGISPDSMMVYILIGYADGETHEDRDRRRSALRAFGARPYPMPYVKAGELGEELRAFANWCVYRKDVVDPATGQPFVPWEKWWGKARGNPRKLGTRRVSLPLFPERS